MSKKSYQGKQINKSELTEHTLLHCRMTLTFADTLRRSGKPEMAIQFLTAVFDTMLRIIHRQFVAGHPNDSPNQMLENLKNGGHIGCLEFDSLRACRAILGESPSGRDVNIAIAGTTQLSNFIKSEVFRNAKPSLLPGEGVALSRSASGKSLWGRLTTAAASLFTIGGAA